MADGDYDVGYGRPPKHSRWPPGKSGNAEGRKKGARGLKSDLNTVLSETHSIQINGNKVKGTVQMQTLRTLALRAATGDIRAAKILLEFSLQIFGSGDRGGAGEQLSPNDQKLLDEFLKPEAAEGQPLQEAGPQEGHPEMPDEDHDAG